MILERFCGGNGWDAFIEGADRSQITLFPESLEDWIDEDNPVRVIDIFVEEPVFLGRSPDTATAEDLRRFQLHQTQTGVRAPSINGSVAALRFFFTVTRDVQARLFTLAPGETIPWHFHRTAADHYFVLEGALTVVTREPDSSRTIEVGSDYRIMPSTAHLIANRSTADCRFLLLQGVGKHDWVKLGH